MKDSKQLDSLIRDVEELIDTLGDDQSSEVRELRQRVRDAVDSLEEKRKSATRRFAGTPPRSTGTSPAIRAWFRHGRHRGRLVRLHGRGIQSERLNAHLIPGHSPHFTFPIAGANDHRRLQHPAFDAPPPS